MDRLRQTDCKYDLPRVAALLYRPEFAALQQTLADFGAHPEDLQEAVDALVAEARRRAASEE